jgi:hypothetical protein
MIIVEHFPDVVLKTIQRAPDVYEWFINEWVHLASINPETHEISIFKEGRFTSYRPLKQKIEVVSDLTPIIETHEDNLPVYALSH